MQEIEGIIRLKRGEIDGMHILVRVHSLRALRAAYLITHDQALVEDVVQDAFIRAYQGIAGFDLKRPFGPWGRRHGACLLAPLPAAGRQLRIAGGQGKDRRVDAGAAAGTWGVDDRRQTRSVLHQPDLRAPGRSLDIPCPHAIRHACRPHLGRCETSAVRRHGREDLSIRRVLVAPQWRGQFPQFWRWYV